MLKKNTKLLKVLEEIEEKNRQENFWIVGPETGRVLHLLVRVFEPKVLLEIGTSVGYSAIYLASALQENGHGKLWTIESHKKRFELAKLNIKKTGLKNIVQIMGHAPEIFFERSDSASDPDLPEKIDMAFFDAFKKDTGLFFDAVFPRLSHGGLIIVDNVLSHRHKSMLAFIESVYLRKDLKVVELAVGSGLLLVVKIKTGQAFHY